MLIKDLVIKDEHGKIEFFCDVIIKRDEKHYRVPVRIKSNRGDLIETIDYALEKCEYIDEHWLVPKEGAEVVEHLRGMVIGAIEIKL